MYREIRSTQIPSPTKVQISDRLRDPTRSHPTLDSASHIVALSYVQLFPQLREWVSAQRLIGSCLSLSHRASSDAGSTILFPRIHEKLYISHCRCAVIGVAIPFLDALRPVSTQLCHLVLCIL